MKPASEPNNHFVLDVVAADSSETERAVAPRYNANPRYNMRKRSAYK